jgi:hypothetical protein
MFEEMIGMNHKYHESFTNDGIADVSRLRNYSYSYYDLKGEHFFLNESSIWKHYVIDMERHSVRGFFGDPKNDWVNKEKYSAFLIFLRDFKLELLLT